MNFKTRFEGRERTVTKSDRKRNPSLYSRDKECRTTTLLSFEGGDAKRLVIRRRTQRAGRDIILEEVSQVLRGSFTDNLIAGT